MPEGCYQLYPLAANHLRAADSGERIGICAPLALLLVAALILSGCTILFKENAHDRRGHRLNTSHQPGLACHDLSRLPSGARKSGFEQQVRSLDELISSDSLSMSRSGRDGYTYEINCRVAPIFRLWPATRLLPKDLRSAIRPWPSIRDASSGNP